MKTKRETGETIMSETYLVRSDSHVDYAWLRVSEEGTPMFMYTHEHATRFATREAAEKASIAAKYVWDKLGFPGLTFTLIPASQMEGKPYEAKE